MLALAAALLLGTPLALAVLPIGGGDVFDAYAEAVATVEDVVLFDPPAPVTGRTGDFREEQVVEGHTTFLTLDIKVWRNQTSGRINITGFVECKHEAEVEHAYFWGIVPVPRRVERAHAECRVGEHVFVAPDPFVPPGSSLVARPTPTGEVYTYHTPTGELTYAEEYSYTVVSVDDWGEPVPKRMYAWSTPVHAPWIHTDGRPKSFLVPLPEDRLREMGVEHFEIVLKDEVRSG